ncbi:ABC transporter permease [Streptomyces sp. NPDC090025]|uniref:ABC transporter permease n=1 Tax=Streptomyces sp. NPDC090025 TaxID=3365922 RepID=UPI0038386A32
MSRTPARTVAPWVRTRLRTHRSAAVAFGLLVLVTAFLAAALPRAVDTYETEGLWHAVDTAEPRHTAMVFTSEVPLNLNAAARASELAPEKLRSRRDALLGLLKAPLRSDQGQSSYGARTTKPLPADDPFLTRVDRRVPPDFFLAAPDALAAHSTLIAGRAPKAGKNGAMEGAVTAKTARTMNLKPGSVIHVPGTDAVPKPITITGIVEPRDLAGGYWSADPVLHTPFLGDKSNGGPDPVWYWGAAVLVAPESAPTMVATLGEPERYWSFGPDVRHLTARDTDRLSTALDAMSSGPGLVALRDALGETGGFNTGLDETVAGYRGTRDAVSAVVAVATFGIGAVAAVVIAMTSGLFLARRRAELALLRARGGSLTGIGLRLLGETSVVAVPAAALGLLLALTVTGDHGARLWPACLGAAAVALVSALVLPLRAVLQHRRPQAHGARDDLVTTRPTARRTIAELTLLILAVGAVTALRRRGAGDAGDHLISAAPVLVALIAAFVLIRVYPLPLRWAARPARRLRGALGFLSLARAGRSSTSGALPLLALMLALTTAAFGGSVLSGVSDVRDRAAILAVGADARVAAELDSAPLPAGLADMVRKTAGVREVSPLQIEYGVLLPSPLGTSERSMSAPLIGVEPGSYAALAARTGFGAFPAGLLASTGTGGPAHVGDNARVIPAIASPKVAERLGGRPMEITAAAGRFHVKVVAVRDVTPALPDAEFLVVNGDDLTNRSATALLVSGGGDRALDGPALRAAVTAKAKNTKVLLRTEARATYVDSPLQNGAEGMYQAAIGAGAGFAVLAVLLSLLQTAPERTTLLARLRTMGLTRRQGRRLLGLEALPQALLAAGGGALVGWATIALLSPGIDLTRLALAAAPDEAMALGTVLRADGLSLATPALAVVLLTAAVAGIQAWWVARSGSIKELRAGDAR